MSEENENRTNVEFLAEITSQIDNIKENNDACDRAGEMDSYHGYYLADVVLLLFVEIAKAHKQSEFGCNTKDGSTCPVCLYLEGR